MVDYMKKAMVDYMKAKKNDDLYTPKEAIEPVLKYLPVSGKAWEPCDAGGSNISRLLLSKGYEVITTDIKTGLDFLSRDVDFDFDFIITNPPYSLKDEFIRRCYEYGKPFALLLPLTALEGQARGKMFRDKGISVVVLDKPINFTDKKNVWFNTSWFLWGMDEGNRLYFETVRAKGGD